MQISCFRVCSASEWVTTTNHHPLRSEPDYRLCSASWAWVTSGSLLAPAYEVLPVRRPVHQRATSRQRRGVLARYSIANWCYYFPPCTCRKHTRTTIDPISINVRQTSLCSLKQLITYICALHSIAVGLSQFFTLRWSDCNIYTSLPRSLYLIASVTLS